MKKYILLFWTLILTIPLFAQLEVKPDSFKEVPGFVNINPDENYQTDDNDLPFAVIKIRTENINDKQRRELSFSGNAGTFIMLEYKDGEVWVYLTAQYADYLKISHPDLSSIEYTLPFDLKPKCGYEMTLVNKSESISNRWASLTITTSPENGADISLNGRPLNQTTPYTNNMIPAGKYEITVSKFGFEDVTKTMVINEGESTNFGIDMPYKYGNLNIVSDPSEAIVYIDDVECGSTPLTINNIKYGMHNLKICHKNMKDFKQQVTINNGNLIEIDAILENCPNGAINGLFSVSPTKQVYFSQGNLQYKASTKTWRFAENQWDYIGMNNKNISNDYNGWIDLFGWGTGNNPSKSSTKANSYKTFYDWGLNTISNGAEKNWRTLTKDEWIYVLDERNTNSGIRYVIACINGVIGIVLIPDTWDKSIYSIKAFNILDRGESLNFISQYDWINKFEANGAVFLPAAGKRFMNEISFDNLDGYYWSATYCEKWYSYCVHFSLILVDSACHHMGNDIGQSVRLVCDIE
ncbi:MAG: PEGA domain-containing protein [Bacteroidales bacterium]|nr:PEGA domain-containing protein [Bacteroidales bacterium]